MNAVRLLFELALCSLLAVTLFKRYDEAERKVKTDLRADRVTSDSSKELFLAVNNTASNALFEKIRVLCWVMTSPKYHWTRARHVKLTWGRRCNELVFISTVGDKRIPTVGVPADEGYDNLWGKTREGFRYVWQNYKDKAEWFLKADDDSYIILENLRYFLEPFNSSEPLYFGHRFRAYVDSGYMQGGSGYVLSREALRRFADIGLNDPDKCDPLEWPEDVRMGQCMQNLSCRPVDTRDSHGRERFLPLSLESHLTLGLTENTWFWEIHPSYYPIQLGYKCCSDTAIGFHQVPPESMHLFEYLIYYVRPFGVQSVREELQLRPFPSPDHGGQEPAFDGPSNETLALADAVRRRNEAERESPVESDDSTRVA